MKNYLLGNEYEIAVDFERRSIVRIAACGKNIVRGNVPFFAVKLRNEKGASRIVTAFDCLYVSSDEEGAVYRHAEFDIHIFVVRRDRGLLWRACVKNKTKDLLEWVQELEERGAGEILLTSMDADGTTAGYDLEMTKAVCDLVNIPVIASGGAGSVDDFADVFAATGCDAALAASLFHYGELTIDEVKDAMRARGIPAR